MSKSKSARLSMIGIGSTFIFQVLSHSIHWKGVGFVFGLLGWVSFLLFVVMLVIAVIEYLD